jgi:hypothetical protein
MSGEMMKHAQLYRHREDHDLVIRIVRSRGGTVSVCTDEDGNSTIFHLTKEELEYNFEPFEEDVQHGTDDLTPKGKESSD